MIYVDIIRPKNSLQTWQFPESYFTLQANTSVGQHVQNVVRPWLLLPAPATLNDGPWQSTLDELWLQPSLRLGLTIVTPFCTAHRHKSPAICTADGAKRRRPSGCWCRQVWPRHSGPSWCPSLAACASMNTVQGSTHCSHTQGRPKDIFWHFDGQSGSRIRLLIFIFFCFSGSAVELGRYRYLESVSVFGIFVGIFFMSVRYSVSVSVFLK